MWKRTERATCGLPSQAMATAPLSTGWEPASRTGRRSSSITVSKAGERVCPLRPAGRGKTRTSARTPAWTDARTVFYGPGFEALSLDLQVGIAAHQILHAALRHPARDRSLRLRLGPKADARLFNIAADALVNETLLAAGYALPRPCLTLAPLLSRALGDTTPAADALQRWDAEALTLALLEARRSGGRASGGEGEAPGRAESEAAREAARAAFAPDIEASEAAPGGEAQAAEEEAEWRQRVARAMEEGRLAGRGIGALGFRIADLPRSTVPWERTLRALAARALQEGARPDWARPAGRWVGMEAEARRRGAPVPVYQPGLARRRTVPRLAVGIDASGSVDDARLGLFLGQVAGIAARQAAEIHMLVFDTEVRRAAKVPPSGVEAWLGRQPLARGGGTSYEDLFREAEALRPALLIVLTDLEAPVPPPGRVPVLWAVPEAPRRPPRHGRVLDLSE